MTASAGGTVVFVQGGEKKEGGDPWVVFHPHPHTEPPAGAGEGDASDPPADDKAAADAG